MEQHDANRAAPRQPEPGEHEINVPLSALAALMEGHERIGNRIDRVEAMATAASQIINAVRTWRDTPGQVKGRSNMRGLAQAEQAILDALSEYEALAAPDTTTETTDE